MPINVLVKFNLLTILCLTSRLIVVCLIRHTTWFYTGPADINIGRASIKPIIERLATLWNMLQTSTTGTHFTDEKGRDVHNNKTVFLISFDRSLISQSDSDGWLYLGLTVLQLRRASLLKIGPVRIYW